MDTDLARTFLAVVATGSFVAAAQRLHVTQSTVSFRIRRLEETLGVPLFDREHGHVLTAAGRQFQRHAATLVRTVELARQEVGVAAGYGATVHVGCRLGLWENLLLRWLPLFAVRAPGIALRASAGFEDELVAGLVEGRFDIAVMYTPEARPGLRIEPLLDESLVLVSGIADPAVKTPGMPAGDYVYVDWGPEFFARHALAFPDYAGARLTVNLGWLGLEHLLAQGGSGYFPWRLVREHVEAGRLHRVADTPEFTLPAYVCFHAGERTGPVELALATIREVAATYA